MVAGKKEEIEEGADESDEETDEEADEEAEVRIVGDNEPSEPVEEAQENEDLNASDIPETEENETEEDKIEDDTGEKKPAVSIKIGDRGIVVRQSRLSFVYNYALAALVVFLLLLSWSRFNLTFSLFPQTADQLWKSMVVLGFFGVAAFLIEEPAIVGWLRHYIITNTEVIKVEGILTKKKIIIPYQSISDVEFYKGVLGRILNFGDITVTGFQNKIFMKGIRDPEVLYRIMNNKISLIRSGRKSVAKQAVTYRRRKTGEVTEKREDWRSKEKVLRKKLGKGKGQKR